MYSIRTAHSGALHFVLCEAGVEAGYREFREIVAKIFLAMKQPPRVYGLAFQVGRLLLLSFLMARCNVRVYVEYSIYAAQCICGQALERDRRLTPSPPYTDTRLCAPSQAVYSDFEGKRRSGGEILMVDARYSW